MEPRGKGWKTGKLKRRPPARSSRGRRLRRSTTRSASVEITPTARTVTGSFSASVGPSIVRVREAACVNTCGATCRRASHGTPTFLTSTFSSSPKKNDGKADLEPLCEQKNADTDLTATQSGAGHLSPPERHFDRETRLRRCGPNCEIAKPPWIFRPRWRSAGSARIHTVKYLGSSRKKKREKTERRASEAAASPADRPDASSHRARAPTSPREVLAHHRREPGTLEPGRLTARRTPPARETPAKRTENAGYRADTGDTTPRVTGKGAMRAGREARRGSGEMPRHGR